MKHLLYLFLVFFISVSVVQAQGFITVISSQAKLYADAQENAQEVIAPRSLFGQSFDIQEKKDKFYRIRISPTTQAYIRADGLLLRNLPTTDYILAKRLPHSKLTQKVLIVNQPKPGSQYATDINYFDSPDINPASTVLGKISIFEIRYIFAETEQAYLVGRTDRMRQSNTDTVLVGWIEKKHTIEWDSLVGVEFDKTNYNKRLKCELGKIYDTPLELLAENTEPIFHESRYPYELPYYANRFPVLGKFHGPNPYYKIAYIGNAVGKEGESIDVREVAKEKFKIMDILNNDDVQIAILIDATRGMEFHINSVKKAVRKFLHEISGLDDYAQGGQLNASIAVAVYRDYPDGERIFAIKSDFSRNINRLEKSLNSIGVYSNPKDSGPGTYPEAVFYGIDRTIEKLSWKPGQVGERYILMIGDHGNHKRYDQYPQDRVFSAAGIGQKLKAHRISLFALQVNLSEDKRVYNQMFADQVLDIKQNNQGRGGLRKVASRSDANILKGLNEIVNDFLVIKQALVNVRNNTQDIGRIYQGVFTQKLLDRFNLNAKVFNAAQICAIGYVPLKNACNHNQFFEKVLVTRKSLEAMKVQMQELSDAVLYYNPESENKFKRIIFSVVKALTGDEMVPNESIAEFIEKKTGIPVNTQMLHVSLEQLVDNVRQRQFRRLLRKYLEERVMLMDGVIKERMLGQKVWDKDEQRFLYNVTEKRVPFFFSLEQPLPERGKVAILDTKKNHAWVPLEYFP